MHFFSLLFTGRMVFLYSISLKKSYTLLFHKKVFCYNLKCLLHNSSALNSPHSELSSSTIEKIKEQVAGFEP